MLQDFIDFVQEIANEYPIHSVEHETNACRFCGSSWAEGTYDEYLKNVEILKADPDARTPSGIHRIAWEHHYDDCLWIRANELIRTGDTDDSSRS